MLDHYVPGWGNAAESFEPPTEPAADSLAASPHGELGNTMLKCPECPAQISTSKALGSHRYYFHGVAGNSREAVRSRAVTVGLGAVPPGTTAPAMEGWLVDAGLSQAGRPSPVSEALPATPAHHSGVPAAHRSARTEPRLPFEMFTPELPPSAGTLDVPPVPVVDLAENGRADITLAEDPLAPQPLRRDAPALGAFLRGPKTASPVSPVATVEPPGSELKLSLAVGASTSLMPTTGVVEPRLSVVAGPRSTVQAAFEGNGRDGQSVLGEAQALLQEAQGAFDEMKEILRQQRRRVVAHAPAELAPILRSQPGPAESCIGEVEFVSDGLFAGIILAGCEAIDGAERLDKDPRSRVWAAKLHLVLCALDCWAQSCHEGDFRRYCETSPTGLPVVPATWAACDEPPATKNNLRYSKARTFTVPAQVDPSGEIFMGSHIILGNGGTAPRLHYHDDRRGSTGKVLIGYVGPHLPTRDTN